MREILRKRDIEILLDKLKPHPHPRASLEQYTIPSNTAAEILFIASYIFNDIRGKRVADLGCGTGRLAIGSAVLGASEVVGIDVDPKAIKTAKENARLANVERKVQWIISSLDALNGKFNTILQNPPFGVRRKGADRNFIKKALEIGNTIYSLHKSGKENREFIKKLVEKHKGVVTDLFQMELAIPKTFAFHEEKAHIVKVDLYRIVKKCQK
jgi:putative methylase